MDPNTTYVMDIKMLGNHKRIRKDVGCLLIDKVIDSNLINFKDFVESIVEEFSLGYLEVAHIQYFDEAMKNFLEVKLDQYLMLMFSKHSESKFVRMFIQYCPPSDPFVPITECDFDHHGKDKDVDEVEVEDESEDELDEDIEDEVENETNNTPSVDYDKEDPPMMVGTIYGSMDEFKLALC
ncbi:hypothetical protein BS78_02G089700 [Paspalum vaginatum]|nr:hypothetical protein BS78_02G089700 [Paspalum vaginatum]